jgi:hypothetical protein
VIDQLDGVYRTQRLRLRSIVTAATAAAWDAHHQDRERAVAAIVPLVSNGQRQIVHLTAGFMAAKATVARARVEPVTLDPGAYTTAAIRGVSAEAVYERPFGALAVHLGQGADFAAAALAARASLGKLVATDLQLAQTHAARDWLSGQERAVGYRRVLGGGRNCPLCVEASTRTYHIEDLMPIHEHCSCSVSPIFEGEEVSGGSPQVRVEEDPEIGPRLLADSWSSVGPALT